MTPEFNPQAILDDAVNSAKSSASSALIWGAVLFGLVAWVVFSPTKKRR